MLVTVKSLLLSGWSFLPLLNSLHMEAERWRPLPCVTVGWCSLNDLHACCSCAQLLQSFPTLCNSVDFSPPGSSIHGILQARILEWVAISFSRGSSQPRDQTSNSCFGIAWFELTFTQINCLTLYDLTVCSLPAPSIHGILQARILEWISIPFSRGSSQPRDQTWFSCIAGRFFTTWAIREVPSNSPPRLLLLKNKTVRSCPGARSILLPLGAKLITLGVCQNP